MLDRLVRDDPPQSKRALAIENQIREYVYFFVPTLIPILQEEPGITRAGRDLRPEQQVLHGRDPPPLRRVPRRRNKLAAQAGRDADHRTDLAVLVGAVAVGASMALIALFGIVLARSIGRPVRAVAGGADRIGDLSYRLPEEGPGEVGELTRAFNEMAERLEVEPRRARAAERGVARERADEDRLVSIVSHELRTPLASVLGFTALLLKREFDAPAATTSASSTHRRGAWPPCSRTFSTSSGSSTRAST